MPRPLALWSPCEPDDLDLLPWNVYPPVCRPAPEEGRAEADVVALDARAVVEDGGSRVPVVRGGNVRRQRAAGRLAGEEQRSDAGQGQADLRPLLAQQDRLALPVSLQRLRLLVQELTDGSGRAEQHRSPGSRRRCPLGWLPPVVLLWNRDRVEHLERRISQPIHLAGPSTHFRAQRLGGDLSRGDDHRGYCAASHDQCLPNHRSLPHFPMLLMIFMISSNDGAIA